MPPKNSKASRADPQTPVSYSLYRDAIMLSVACPTSLGTIAIAVAQTRAADNSTTPGRQQHQISVRHA
jgi:hypothetical protein